MSKAVRVLAIEATSWFSVHEPSTLVKYSINLLLTNVTWLFDI